MRVRGDGEVGDIVLKAALAAGVTVRQISPGRTSMEQIFLESVGEAADAGL